MATSPTRTERAEPRMDPDLDPETGATLTGDRSGFTRTTAPRRNPIVWLVLLMVLAAGAVFFYLWRQNPLPPALAPQATQPAAAQAAPAIRHPIEDAQSASAPTAPARHAPRRAISSNRRRAPCRYRRR